MIIVVVIIVVVIVVVVVVVVVVARPIRPVSVLRFWISEGLTQAES